MEDDEDEVLSALSGGRVKPSLTLTEWELQRRGMARWSHPFWSRCLCAQVDGVTLLSPSLKHFVPKGVPSLALLPPVGRREDDETLQARSYVRGQILFSGTVNEAVEKDFLVLAEAVGRLVRSGFEATLVRSGANGPRADRILRAARRSAVNFRDLGYLPETELPVLIARSAILVQPGLPTRFNRGRFPAKLLPYLRSGRPIVLPAIYRWIGLVDGENCLLLVRGTVEEVEEKLRRLLDDPAGADALGDRGRQLGEELFSEATVGETLARFYEQVLACKPRGTSLNVPDARSLLAWKTAADTIGLPRSLRVTASIFASNLDPLQRSLGSLLIKPGPLVSVIVPCFNHKPYLKRRLASVSAQTYRNIEVILLDDGSTDGSTEMLRSHALPFPTRLFSNDRNGGNPFAQWAKGLGHSRGDFVWIAESDDEAEPEFVSRLLAFLAASPAASFAFCQSSLVGPDDQRLGSCRDFLDHSDGRWATSHAIDSDACRELFIAENFVPNASACLFKADALRSALMSAETYRVCGDWAVYAHLVDTGGLCYVTESLNRYRQHQASVRAATVRNGLYWVERYRIQGTLASEGRYRFLTLEESRQRSANLLADHLSRSEEAIPSWWPSLVDATLRFDPFFPARLLVCLRARSGRRIHPLTPILESQIAALLETTPYREGEKVLMIVAGHLASGGAEQYLLEFLRVAKTELSLRICLVTTRNGNDEWWDRFSDVADERLSLARLVPNGEMGSALRQLMGSRRPTYLGISHSEVAYHYLGAIAAEFPGTKVFDILHLVSPSWRNGGFPRLSIAAGGCIVARVVVSSNLRDWLVQNGAPSDGIHVVRAGVPTHEGAARRTRPKGPVRLVFVGRLVDAKQPRVLAEIAYHLSAEGHEFQLEIAGDGPDASWVVDELLPRYPESVIWHGEMDREEVGRVLDSADFLILPSKEEGLALVLLEAMQRGVIPLATLVGGQSELVSDECGVLFPVTPALSESMAETIMKLWADPARLEAMAESCRERIRNCFSTKRFANDVAALLQALERRPSAERHSSPGQFIPMNEDQQRELIGAPRFSLPVDEWQRARDQGKQLVRLASHVASYLRQSPLGPVFTRFEARYGSKIGRTIVRLAKI
ncbi:MAG: glycosyltransferase [Opitutaceae bacterium]|nr:glycosyltransferase [Opitutaceae bacterium]